MRKNSIQTEMVKMAIIELICFSALLPLFLFLVMAVFGVTGIWYLFFLIGYCAWNSWYNKENISIIVNYLLS